MERRFSVWKRKEDVSRHSRSQFARGNLAGDRAAGAIDLRSLARRGHADRAIGASRADRAFDARTTGRSEVGRLAAGEALAAVLALFERLVRREEPERAGIARHADRARSVAARARRAAVGAGLADRGERHAARLLAREAVRAERFGAARSVGRYLQTAHSVVAACVQWTELERSARVADREERCAGSETAARPLAALRVEETGRAPEVVRASTVDAEGCGCCTVCVSLTRAAQLALRDRAGGADAEQIVVAGTRFAFVTEGEAGATHTTEARRATTDERSTRLSFDGVSARSVADPPKTHHRDGAEVSLTTRLAQITKPHAPTLAVREAHAREVVRTIGEADARLTQRATRCARGTPRRWTVEAVRTKVGARETVRIAGLADRERALDRGVARTDGEQLDRAPIARRRELVQTLLRELGIQRHVGRELVEPVFDTIRMTHRTGGEPVPSLATDGAVALGSATRLQELADLRGHLFGVSCVSAVVEDLAVTGRVGGWCAIGSVAPVGTRRARARASDQKEERESRCRVMHESVYHGSQTNAMSGCRSGRKVRR